MNKKLKLIVNNSTKMSKENFFFEKDELKIILDLYAKMVSKGSWRDLVFLKIQLKMLYIIFVKTLVPQVKISNILSLTIETEL